MELDTFNLAVIVDDERVDQMLTERALEKSGLFKKVLCFVSAEEAIDALTAEPKIRPDLLLLDINLPGMSGIEFLGVAQSRLEPAFTRSLGLLLTNPLLEHERQTVERMLMTVHEFRKPIGPEDLDTIKRSLNA